MCRQRWATTAGTLAIIVMITAVGGFSFVGTVGAATQPTDTTLTAATTAQAGGNVTVTGQLTDQDGTPAANTGVVFDSADSDVFKGVKTDSSGRYEATVPAGERYTVTSVGERNASLFFTPRNGVVDLWTVTEITPTGDMDMGTTRLPNGHVVRINVTDTSGQVLREAAVTITPRSGGIEGSSYTQGFLGGDEFSFLGRDTPGVELHGEYGITVDLSGVEGNFEETRLNRTTEVRSDRSVEFVATRMSEDAGPPAVCPGGAAPTDPGGDGIYEDADGDGSFTVFDVQCLLDQFGTAAVQDNAAAFDFTDDGDVSVFDVQAALDRL